MDKNIKDQLKESFFNIQFIMIFIITIVFIILYVFLEYSFLLYFIMFGLILVLLYIIGFFRGIKMRKHVALSRSGELKYEPYSIDRNRFIDECKIGLMYSLIRINGQIYEVETQLDKINSTNYNDFICYINDNEIKGVDNFLSFKFDGMHSFNDLDYIEFLEYNSSDPKKYFVDNII